MKAIKIGFDINEYTIFIFVLVVLIFSIMLYYNFRIYKLENKIEKLHKNKLHKRYVKHIKRKH